VNLDKEADGMQNEWPIGSSQEAEEFAQLDNLLERTTISGINFVPHSFEPKNYDMMAHQTSFCEESHCRAVFNFNVYSQHKRNYLVTMWERGNFITMATKIDDDSDNKGNAEDNRGKGHNHNGNGD
jgi:hypothetical protein